MSLAKYNKNNGGIDWNISTEGWKFQKALEMEDGEYPFLGGFTTKDNGYGEGVVIISDGYLVNAPASFLDTFKEVIADQEAVDLIKEGNEVFVIEHYKSKKYKEKVNGKMVPKECVSITLK